jgi:arylsulfatase A-like enzyme
MINAVNIPRLLATLSIALTAILPYSRANAEKPSLLMIMIDTQRMDAAGCYGNNRPTTPILDRISQNGTLSVNAVSTCCWTTPATASMITGLYPSTMRGKQPAKLPPSDKAWFWRWRFSEEALTLAEHLKENGYATAGFVANNILTSDRGFAQGFDQYKLVKNPSPADKVNREVMEFIDQDLKDTPFFLYVHYYDPHGPYRPPKPWLKMMDQPESAQGRPLAPELFKKDYGYLRIAGLKTLEQYRDRYHAEVRYTDQFLGELIRALARKGLHKNLNIVISSDHGETFLEHGKLGHRNYLYQEEIKVPLIFQGPKVPKGWLHPGLTQIIDAFPSVCNLLKIPIPKHLTGVNLFSTVPQRLMSRHIITETNTRHIQRAIHKDNWKLIMDQNDRSRLFNLKTDPQESRNVIKTHKDVSLQLKVLLDQWAQGQLNKQLPTLSIDVEKMDPEIVKSLEALGYISE